MECVRAGRNICQGARATAGEVGQADAEFVLVAIQQTDIGVIDRLEDAVAIEPGCRVGLGPVDVGALVDAVEVTVGQHQGSSAPDGEVRGHPVFGGGGP